MNKSNKAMGIAMAITAAGLLSTTPIVMAGSSGKNIHCYGVNKCKGHNDCKTVKNACKGHASCKGKGFVSVSEKACDHLGGKVGK